MKKRIIISVSSDLNTDQRVLKVANTCFQYGYEVLLVGRSLKNSQTLNLPYKFKRFLLFFNHSAFFYAELNIRLLFLLLFSKVDILLSNDTDTLIANFLVSKIRRIKLVFDAHELFPEVPELTNRPKIKKIWICIENWIFPHLKYSYTVCQSIANYYNHKYKIDMQLVRNMPNYRHFREKKIAYSHQKIILYQGALNVGRGLEWVLEAMPFIENAKLVIIGDGDIREKLERKVKELNIGNKVEFIGKVNGNELWKYTPSADIGLCLLENKGLSYYYALPNRIFDYILAGVPVLATDFPEIRNIVTPNSTGILINNYNAEYLANTIINLLENPINTTHFDTLAKELCWEKEEIQLMKIINSAIEN